MGRSKTTGRFATRKELENYVWHLWFNTGCKQVDIKRNCEVSHGTVAKIIDEKTKIKNNPKTK